MSHLNRKQVTQYLDGNLSADERRLVWQHIQTCERCRDMLQREDDLRRELLHELPTFGHPDNLSSMLSGILSEANRPAIMNRYHVMAVLITLVMLVGFVQFGRQLRFDFDVMQQPLLNEPNPTQPVPTQSNVATEEPPLRQASEERVAVSFSVNYASPVPLPTVSPNTTLETETYGNN